MKSGVLEYLGRAAIAAAAFVFLAACEKEQPAASIYPLPPDKPQTLSDWGILSAQKSSLNFAPGATPYELATPLFSDYALKLRTVTLPDGATARYEEAKTFGFPVGSVITKTFYYPEKDGVFLQGAAATGTRDARGGFKFDMTGYRLIETRLLVHRDQGWEAMSYIWDADQKEAFLKRTGAIIPATLQRADGRREEFAYLAPNENQCAGCHATDSTTRAIHPIGPKARHLNTLSPIVAGANQLDHWRETALVSGDFDVADAPKNAVWTNPAAPLAERARAYLDINCSHCHSATGPADTSGLNYEPHIALGPTLGLCKSPIAAGGGSGGRPFDIVPGAPSQSIMVFRMTTNDPGAMMPELGRAVVHEEGASLIKKWVASIDGACS